MKLRLTGRLTLALVAVTLIGLTCAAAIYQVIAGNVFNDLVVAETSDRFTHQVIDYYNQHGSLDGINDFFNQQHAQQVAQVLGVAPSSVPQLSAVPSGAAPVPPGSSPPEPAGPGGPPPPSGPGPVIVFAFADTHGVIVLPGGSLTLGQHVPSATLSGGVPVGVNGQLIGTALLPGGPLPWSAEQQEYVRRTRVALGLAAAAGVVVASVVGVLLARGISRPIRTLTEAVRALRQDESTRVPVKGADELAELASGFNDMSEDLAASHQARRQMTADIVHELRNPLTTISGYAEAMRDGDLEPTQQRLDAVFRQAERLARVVEDLRTLSLADVGGLPLAIESVAPAELLQSAVANFAVTAGQKDVHLDYQADGDLGLIAGDSQRLGQVLSNLVANAVRHTPAGGTVRLTGRREDSSIVLTVADTGEGISPEELPHIFNRLFRAGPAAQRDRGGSGLGLAIVKAIVTAHGGTITASSELGVGTTFTIRLPYTEAGAPELTAA